MFHYMDIRISIRYLIWIYVCHMTDFAFLIEHIASRFQNIETQS